jgi:hypothetical protein
MVKKQKQVGRGQGAKKKNMRKGGKWREKMANLVWVLCRRRIITADDKQT